MAVETSAGNTEEDINFEVKRGGNVCLTCGARARSVVTREVDRTWHCGRQERVEAEPAWDSRGLALRCGPPRSRVRR